jgi:hypothetical protein
VTKSRTSRTGITKKRKKIKTLIDKLPNDQGEWLELVIHFTERAIKHPEGGDAFLVAQAARLKAELAEWRKANE